MAFGASKVRIVKKPAEFMLPPATSTPRTEAAHHFLDAEHGRHRVDNEPPWHIQQPKKKATDAPKSAVQNLLDAGHGKQKEPPWHTDTPKSAVQNVLSAVHVHGRHREKRKEPPWHIDTPQSAVRNFLSAKQGRSKIGKEQPKKKATGTPRSGAVQHVLDTVQGRHQKSRKKATVTPKAGAVQQVLDRVQGRHHQSRKKATATPRYDNEGVLHLAVQQVLDAEQRSSKVFKGQPRKKVNTMLRSDEVQHVLDAVKGRHQVFKEQSRKKALEQKRQQAQMHAMKEEAERAASVAQSVNALMHQHGT
jgi:hypothetical protein